MTTRIQKKLDTSLLKRRSSPKVPEREKKIKISQDYNVNGFDDLLLNNKARSYNKQNWVKNKEIEEFLDVFLFNSLEDCIIWNSYYSEPTSRFYKCASEKCQARMKIEIENRKEEEKDEQSGKISEKKFSSAVIKKVFDLKPPKLTIYFSGSHEMHESSYKDDAKDRLTGLGIHPLIKKLIELEELYYHRPKQTLSILRERSEIPEKYLPSKEQLSTFCSSLRKNLISKIVLGEKKTLEEFVQQRKYELANEEFDLIVLDDSKLKAEDFLLIFTSKSLLKNILIQKEIMGRNFLYIDATYKLLNSGFSLLTIGTENKQHNMIPIAFGISSHENEDAYKRFVSAIKSTLEKHLKFALKPKFIVSDAAESIANAMAKEFPNSDHIRCFYHAVKACRDKIFRWKVLEEKKELKEKWGLINYAMRLLHQTSSDEDFLELWTLIERDWVEKYPADFVSYFKKNFVNNREKLRWNRMEKIGFNLTNNSLERLHGEIKKTYTEHKKLSLAAFLVKASTLVKDYSLDSKDWFIKPISEKIEIWKKAINLSRKSPRGPHYDICENVALFVKKKRKIENLQFRKDLYSEYHDLKIDELESLSEFIAIFDYFRVCCLSNFTCNCKYFLSHTYCQHILAIKLQKKLIKPPDNRALKDWDQGVVGRPAQVGGALSMN